MTSPDERIDAANAMRDAAEKYTNGNILNAIIQFLCIDFDGRTLWHDILTRLADFIDPMCAMEYGGYLPESVKGMLGVYFCSECGAPIYNDVWPAYCPYCGCRVVRCDDASER